MNYKRAIVQVDIDPTSKRLELDPQISKAKYKQMQQYRELLMPRVSQLAGNIGADYIVYDDSMLDDKHLERVKEHASKNAAAWNVSMEVKSMMYEKLYSQGYDCILFVDTDVLIVDLHYDIFDKYGAGLALDDPNFKTSIYGRSYYNHDKYNIHTTDGNIISEFIYRSRHDISSDITIDKFKNNFTEIDYISKLDLQKDYGYTVFINLGVLLITHPIALKKLCTVSLHDKEGNYTWPGEWEKLLRLNHGFGRDEAFLAYQFNKTKLWKEVGELDRGDHAFPGDLNWLDVSKIKIIHFPGDLKKQINKVYNQLV